jgi:hypothetical protein
MDSVALARANMLAASRARNPTVGTGRVRLSVAGRTDAHATSARPAMTSSAQDMISS